MLSKCGNKDGIAFDFTLTVRTYEFKLFLN